MYIKRAIEKEINEISKQFACLSLYGARGVGKVTLVRSLFKSFNYVSLDNYEAYSLAAINPKLFLKKYPYPVIIAEIERAPALLSLIKMNIDEYKYNNLINDRPNSLIYILTCSNELSLNKSAAESLAGRTAVLSLASLSSSEINNYDNSFLFNPDINVLMAKAPLAKYRTRHEVFIDIFNGGMPGYIAKDIDRDYFFSSYLREYLDNAVNGLIKPTNLLSFERFIRYLALKTAQELNYTDIGNTIGIATETVKEWLAILIESGIVILIEPYMKNISNRIIKAPKLYFLDTGLCAYLCSIASPELLDGGDMSDAFYETYVVSELIKNYYNNGVDPKDYIYYYRDRDQKKVALIIDMVDSIYPIEIKKDIKETSKKQKYSFLAKYNKEIKPGLVIGSFDGIRKISDTEYYIPIDYIGK